MDIVMKVTAVAAGRHFLLVSRPPVACITMNLAVFVFERKLGFVVIVDRFLPVRRSMTVLTFRVEAPLVFIVIPVTGNTRFTDILFKRFSPVARFTEELTMFIFQGKLRFFMIENGTLPIFR
jgi:hypothetical protein